VRISLADEIAMLRARIASAFDALRRAAERQLIQHYGVKLAGLSLYLRREEIPAATAALMTERQAALQTLYADMRDKERHQQASVAAQVKRAPAARTSAASKPGWHAARLFGLAAAGLVRPKRFWQPHDSYADRRTPRRSTKRWAVSRPTAPAYNDTRLG
jgi:hypothetical protein